MTNLNLEKLAVLDLANTRITEKWEGWNQIKVHKKNSLNTVTDLSFIIDPSVQHRHELEL